MKVLEIKKKEENMYNVMYELKLDNGEYIFFNETMMSFEIAESEEHLMKINDVECTPWVLKESIIDKIGTPDEEEVWKDPFKFMIEDCEEKIYDVDFYNSYMNLILSCEEFKKYLEK